MQIHRATWAAWFERNYGWTWEQVVTIDAINIAASFVIYERWGNTFLAWSCATEGGGVNADVPVVGVLGYIVACAICPVHFVACGQSGAVEAALVLDWHYEAAHPLARLMGREALRSGLAVSAALRRN